MVDSTIHGELIKELERLPEAAQRRVLDFARSLTEAKPKGVLGKELLKYWGTMSDEDAEEIRKAAEQCRKIDHDEW